MKIIKAIKAKIVSFYCWMLTTQVAVEAEYKIQGTKASWMKMKATDAFFAVLNAIPLIISAALVKPMFLAIGLGAASATIMTCLVVTVISMAMGYLVWEACVALQVADITVSV